MKYKLYYIIITVLLVFTTTNTINPIANSQKSKSTEEVSENSLQVRSTKYATDSSIYIYNAAGFVSKSESGDGTPENPYIIRNKIINASLSVSGHGIYIQDTEVHFILENNTIYNATELSSGIFLYKVKNGIIRNNTIYNNTGNGIICSESSSIIISNNTLYSSKKRGLYIRESNGIEISDNCVYTNNLGSYVMNSKNIIFQDNNLSNNELHGIYLYESNHSFIRLNKLHNNGGYGLYLRKSPDNELSFNDICFNQQSGIHVTESSNYNTLHKNDIESNLNCGVDLRFSHNNQLTNNSLVSNEMGLIISGSDHNQVAFNRAQTSNQNGYYFLSANNNTLDSNIAYNNGKYGFKIQADNNTLKCNIIRENSEYGLVLMDVTDNIIKNNNFLFNNLGEQSQACDNGTDNIFESNFWQDYQQNDTHYQLAGTAKNNDTLPLTENLFSPSAPQQLQVWPGSSYAFLNWTISNNNGGYTITNYKIYRSTVSGTNYTLIDSVENTTHVYHDFSLTNGLNYYYVVRAENIAGESGNSAEVVAQPGNVPSPPQNVTARETSDGIEIRWSVSLSNGGNEITNYRIYRSTTSMSSYALLGTVSASTFTYNDTSIERGVTYYYVVRAVNSIGASSYSEEAQITLEPITSSSSSSTISTSSDTQTVTSTSDSSSRQSSNQDSTSSEKQPNASYDLLYSLLGVMTFSVVMVFVRRRKNH